MEGIGRRTFQRLCATVADDHCKAFVELRPSEAGSKANIQSRRHVCVCAVRVSVYSTCE